MPKTYKVTLAVTYEVLAETLEEADAKARQLLAQDGKLAGVPASTTGIEYAVEPTGEYSRVRPPVHSW